MPTFYKRYLLLALLLHWLLPNRGFAYGGPEVTYLGIENGLSNNSVVSIFQDHNGFMWFGTFDGLNRYDGYEIKIFKNVVGDSTSLLSNTVYNIEEDRNHQLWVGGRRGLSVYHPLKQTFSMPRFIREGKGNGARHSVSGSIHHIKADAGGDLWVASELYGLLRFPGGSLQGKTVPFYHHSAMQYPYEVKYIEAGEDSLYLWVFVENEGLGRYDRRRNELRIVNAGIRKANVLRSDKKGGLWIGTDNGLYYYDVRANTLSANYLPERPRIVNISIGPGGYFWISSDGGGIYKVSGRDDKAQPFMPPGGKNVLSSNAVFTVYFDREGRKWIGTLRGGINIIEARQNPFTNVFSDHDRRTEPSKNFINSFCEADNKNVWIGTSGAGLKYWNRRLDTMLRYFRKPEDPHSISSNSVTYMARDFQGTTWLATWNGGVNRIVEPGRTFVQYACVNPITGVEEKNVWVVLEDSRKTLWVSTTNNGTLYTLNRARDKFELFDPRLINMQCLAEDRRGSLWGGNYSAVIEIDRDARKHRVFEVGYPVRSLHEDRQGNFWVGTDGGGLLQFDRKTGRYLRYTVKQGLAGNAILRILEDGKGFLWLSSFSGLTRFDPRKKEFRTFSESDGLHTNQYNFNAAKALSTGELMFGGIRGFTIFHPDSIIDHYIMPQAVLTGLSINNKPIEQNDAYVSRKTIDSIEELRIPFRKAMVNLKFTALEYRAPGKIRYAYKLEGWDKGWIDAGRLRSAYYTRLNEGTYVFKIKHTNASGQWSEEKALVKMVVLPPWYRSWWAFLLYLLAAGFIINQIIRYTKKLEVLVAERTRELQRSNEDLQQFAHVASHDLKEPVRKIKTYTNFLEEAVSDRLTEREKSFLEKVQSSANRMLVMIDGVLTYSTMNSQEQTFEPVDLNEVLEHIKSDLEVAINHKGAVIQHTKLPEVAGAQVLLYQLFYNLINNSLKFSKAGTPPVIFIESSIVGRHGKEWAHIVVKDNGIGFDQKYAERVFDTFTRLNAKAKYEGTGLGLALCKKIVERHGGTITATAKENEGAIFEILLPLKNKGFKKAST